MTISSLSIFAQTKFDKGMAKGFEFWKSGENDKAILMFERIAKTEKTNWIPYYYAANVGITSSFMEKDKIKRELLLKNASAIVDTLMKIEPKNSEIYTLKGLLLTAYVAFDPMVNGMKLTGQTIEAYTIAKQLDPTNPRPYYLLAQFQMGGAKFFNQDVSQYYETIEKSLPIFDKFKPKGPYYPKWGKQQAISMLESRIVEKDNIKKDSTIKK